MDLPIDAVVFLEQGSTACAGAWVDDRGTLVTAYHCVSSGGRVRITGSDGRHGYGRVIAADRRLDLAIVSTQDLLGYPWLLPSETAPKPGEIAWALGHPQGADRPGGFYQGMLRWSGAMGVVSAVGPWAIQVSMPLNRGNSGGPILNEQGELWGVVSRKIRGQGLGFAARVDDLDIIREQRAGYGAFGGGFSLTAFGAAYGGKGGVLTFGPRLEAAMRDRLVVGVQVGFAPNIRWDAIQQGEARFTRVEASFGLRQRWGFGRWTTRLEAYGGIADVERWTGTTELDFGLDSSPAAIAGGRVTWTRLGFGADVGWVFDEQGPGIRGALVVTWPGSFGVF